MTRGCPLAAGSPPSAAGPRGGSAGRTDLCFQRLLQEGAGTAEGTVPCLEPSPAPHPSPSPDGGVGQHVLPGLITKELDTQQVLAQLCHTGWEADSLCFPSKAAPHFFWPHCSAKAGGLLPPWPAAFHRDRSPQAHLCQQRACKGAAVQQKKGAVAFRSLHPKAWDKDCS